MEGRDGKKERRTRERVQKGIVRESKGKGGGDRVQGRVWREREQGRGVYKQRRGRYKQRWGGGKETGKRTREGRA